jgi:paraquat-inducible protein B
MSDNGGPIDLPTAGVQHRRRIPLIWIVPILTGLIAAWLAWDTFSHRGPTITIAFESAAGLTAGQSQLKYRNVVMGTVKTIAIAPDLSKVIVTVETVREAEQLLTDKAIFWVVKPQLFAGNVTGLDTLLSGSYIGMRPSTEKGKSQRSFIGQRDPPVLAASAKGTTYKLKSKRLGSISLGSPIFFRDLDVGTVLGWDIGDLASDVTINAFVRAPYDQFVLEDSSFWNASGISMKLGASGIDVQFESLKALLLGGIAFDTAPRANSPVAPSLHSFPLYTSQEVAKSAGFGRQLQLRSNFVGSVAGLAIGADVTLYGLKVGEVTDVSLVYEPKQQRIVAPVSYRIEAERITGISTAQGLRPGVLANELVKRGLRATLQAPSLITGQKIVALEIVPDAPPAELTEDDGVYIVPSSEIGGFDSITRSANELLSKINRIDFDRIGKNLSGAVVGLDNIVNGEQLKKTLAALEGTMVEAQDFVRTLDKDAAPALKRLPAIAAQLQESVTKANHLIGSIEKGYGDQSKFHRDIDRLMPQITETARSIRALSDLLARHPEALIKGRTNTGKE